MDDFINGLAFAFDPRAINLTPFVAALLTAVAIVQTRRWHIAVSGRVHAGGRRQALHQVPTPRIGGVAVLAGLGAGLVHQRMNGDATLGLLLVSVTPVFAVGLLEDTMHCVMPRYRLIAAAAGGLLASAFFGTWIDSVGLGPVDLLLGLAPLGLLFTVFATTGVSHAFNLVDGLNGLSSGIAMLVAMALTSIAIDVGDRDLAVAASVILFSCAGFWMVNYPNGRVFLGDAGAYTIGHLLAWIAVLLAMRHDTVSAWTMLLVFLWPVMDSMLAILRRALTGRSASEPDRMHFHHVVMRALEILVLRRVPRSTANPLASLIVLALAAAPAIAAVAMRGDVGRTVWMIIGFACLYLLLYRTLVAAALRRRRVGSGP